MRFPRILFLTLHRGNAIVRKSNIAMSTTRTIPETTSSEFPAAEVEQRLRDAITRLGKDVAGMREPWEPLFDSLAVVNIVFVVEDVLPGLKVAPEKVVRKGGYQTVEEATADIVNRLRRMWEHRHH